MSSNKKNIFEGFYGIAIGDALGVSVEFTDRTIPDKAPVEDIREYGTHNQQKATWRDDTSISIASLSQKHK